MIYETKADGSFPNIQICINGYSSPYLPLRNSVIDKEKYHRLQSPGSQRGSKI